MNQSQPMRDCPLTLALCACSFVLFENLRNNQVCGWQTTNKRTNKQQRHPSSEHIPLISSKELHCHSIRRTKSFRSYKKEIESNYNHDNDEAFETPCRASALAILVLGGNDDRESSERPPPARWCPSAIAGISPGRHYSLVAQCVCCNERWR